VETVARRTGSGDLSRAFPPIRRLAESRRMVKPDARRVTQKEIAFRAGVDVSTVNKILRRTPGSSFGNETIRRVFRIARELGYDVGLLRHAHRRTCSRKQVKIQADVVFYLEDGSLFDRGKAIVREISLSGALLSDVTLPRRVFPAAPFRAVLRIRIGKSHEVAGRVVRLLHGAGLQLGIKFVELAPAARAALTKLLRVRG